MPRYRYYTCDVFTEVAFGGNQLAVLPEAAGLSPATMQQLAREFNYAETVFVLPAEAGGARRVRIFTPGAEVPFAGHPTLGTAAMLARHGHLGPVGERTTLVLEEPAGPVPVTVELRPGGRCWAELAAPAPLWVGDPVDPALAAAAASLEPGDLRSAPRPASVGLTFLLAEVRDDATLARARPDLAALDRLTREARQPYLHLYSRSSGEFDLRTRGFCSIEPPIEDPATGSANAALAGFLAASATAADGLFRWRIAQGVEIGRPSVLEARAEKRDGQVVGVWMAGTTVPVAEGFVEVEVGG